MKQQATIILYVRLRFDFRLKWNKCETACWRDGALWYFSLTFYLQKSLKIKMTLLLQCILTVNRAQSLMLFVNEIYWECKGVLYLTLSVNMSTCRAVASVLELLRSSGQAHLL